MGIGDFFKGSIKIQNPFYKGNIQEKSADSIQISNAATQLLTLPSTSYISAGSPSWRNLQELIYLLNCYNENPVVQAIINIKADAMANMRFSVKELKTGEIIPLESYDKDQGKLYGLISQPNPLQSTMEWIKQLKVNYEVFGNSYAYASIPVGWENNFTYEDINVINNLHPYCVAPILTGKWLEATTKDEIIKEYKFSGINGTPNLFPTNQVFHTNSVNIKLDKNFTEGRSELIALQKPISNIDAAYESRNVLIYKRGALGILTSEKKDEAMGNLPLSNQELELIQKEFEKYGLMDDQWAQLISPMPLKYQKMAMNVKELMLFEEVESDAIAIANSFGVPKNLMEYYVKGSTFKNLDASEKRFYDSTIIPEANLFMNGLNNFFKTKELGIQLIGSFDHLNCLQINKKEEATTKKINQETSLSAFKIGAIKFNDYLASMGMPADDEIGELRIWDLKPEQLQAIGVTINTGNNGEGE